MMQLIHANIMILTISYVLLLLGKRKAFNTHFFTELVTAQLQALGFCDRASWANCEVRQKTIKVQQLNVYYQHFLNMFWAPLCPSSGEQDLCYCTWCAALVLLDVVGSGCGALRCRVRALWRLLFDSARTPQRSAPQPLPTTSSRTSAAHHVQ